MAWFGTITDFRQEKSSWIVTVDYWEEANPTQKISRVLDPFSLTVTRAEVIAAIKTKGQEVRTTVTLNAGGVIGSVVPIP